MWILMYQRYQAIHEKNGFQHIYMFPIFHDNNLNRKCKDTVYKVSVSLRRSLFTISRLVQYAILVHPNKRTCRLSLP